MFHAENKHGVEMVEIKSSLCLQMIMFYQGMCVIIIISISIISIIIDSYTDIHT